MPIRTDHGRNAALRQLATWPLHSPKRLFALAGLTAALATSITILASATSPTPSPTTATSPTSPTSTPPSTNPSTPSPMIAGEPRTVAQRFADAWVTKTDASTWRTHLGPLCTDEYRAAVLPATTPDLIAATKVTGAPVVRQAQGRNAQITIPLDTLTLALRLQDVTGSGDWRISDAQPAR